MLKSVIVIYLNKLATAMCECVHVYLVLQIMLAEDCSQQTDFDLEYDHSWEFISILHSCFSLFACVGLLMF